jgi:hypothetical protein
LKAYCLNIKLKNRKKQRLEIVLLNIIIGRLITVTETQTEGEPDG